MRKGQKIGGRKCYLMINLKSIRKTFRMSKRCLSLAGYYVRSVYWSQNYSKLSETLYFEKVSNGFILIVRYGIIMGAANAFGVHQCAIY